MKLFTVFFVAAMIFTDSFAFAEAPPIDQPRLHFTQVVTEIIPTSKKTLKTAFSKQSVGPWMTILGTTGVLYYYDEEILQNLQHAGRDWGIGNEDNTRAVLTGFNHDLVRLPSDTGSALYFLGDGWMHTTIATSFLGAGYFSESNRAFNTGLEIFHGMIVSTLFNQTLKRSFGREDPNFSTQKRGRWRPFPSFKAYNSETAKYDAMPSGHIMTATLTFTVIYSNFPEYSAWILPIGGTWLTLLGFEMVNNGVHWASDYPLGIAMGYVIGRMASTMGQPPKADDKKAKQSDVVYFPAVSDEGMTFNMAFSY